MSDENKEAKAEAPEPEKGQSPAGTEWSGANTVTDSKPNGNKALNSVEKE